jgi:hypothetical protein
MSDKVNLNTSVSSFEGRFIFLLLSMVLLFVLFPFVPEEVIGVNFLDIFFSIILLSGLYAVSHRKSLFYLALFFAFTAFGAGILIYFVTAPVIPLIRYISYIFFFFLVILAFLSHLLRAEKVTADIIYGSICIYLLLGMMWAMIYSVLEIFQPGSFLSAMESIGTGSSEFFNRSSFRSLIYYSFVTLTTLGYGDIVPSTPPARMFSILESITGQLYIAILIARLVGLHIVHSKKD